MQDLSRKGVLLLGSSIFLLFFINLPLLFGFESPKKDIVVDARAIEYDTNNMKAVANDAVVVRYTHGKHNCKMECNRLTCWFNSDGTTKQLIATGKVTVTIIDINSQKTTIYCNNCEYSPDNRTIRCQQQIKIVYQNHQVEGQECSMDIESGIATISRGLCSNPVIAHLNFN